MNIKETISIISVILLISCSKDSDIEYDTAFNNQVMLSDITNQLIIPSIINLNTSCIELNNSVENYQELLKLNKAIEKKSHKNFKNISEESNNKVKEITKKNETKK